eukprot:765285-Hanusia_phi.AAC.1
MSTLFNGASSVAQVGVAMSFAGLTASQQGGIAALDNINEVMGIVKYYLENAKLIREVDKRGREADFDRGGGKDVETGADRAWQGFVRISSFGQRDNVIEACK